MTIPKHYIYDILIISTFTVWAIIDVFSLFIDYSLLINLGYSFLFVILFQFSIKHTKYKNNRYRSIIKSIYVLISLIIAPTVVTYFNNTPSEFDASIIINIGVSTQSLFYIFHCRKEKV